MKSAGRHELDNRAARVQAGSSNGRRFYWLSPKQMIKHPNSTYRYYWYYSSLSARRDVAAMGCRRAMI